MTIAGTTTPLLLFHDRPEYRSLCVWEWIFCLVGIANQIVTLHTDKNNLKYCQAFEICLCIFMGGLPFVMSGDQLAVDFPGTGDAMLMGCLVYVAGIPFFCFDPFIPIFHTLWHLFVAVASIIHWIAIWDLVHTLPEDGQVLTSILPAAASLLAGAPHQEL